MSEERLMQEKLCGETYQCDEYEEVISTKAPRDEEAGVRPQANDDEDDNVEQNVEDDNKRTPLLWVNVIRLRPRFHCIERNVHDDDATVSMGEEEGEAQHRVSRYQKIEVHPDR